ncbi:hypothetical protein QBC39DRAFT_437320 [Podospora conica]|nr:hypothetical protein QBC39DRAFT_437320 [Schizothecium conicum]
MTRDMLASYEVRSNLFRRGCESFPPVSLVSPVPPVSSVSLVSPVPPVPSVSPVPSSQNLHALLAQRLSTFTIIMPGGGLLDGATYDAWMSVNQEIKERQLRGHQLRHHQQPQRGTTVTSTGPGSLLLTHTSRALQTTTPEQQRPATKFLQVCQFLSWMVRWITMCIIRVVACLLGCICLCIIQFVFFRRAAVEPCRLGRPGELGLARAPVTRPPVGTPPGDTTINNTGGRLSPSPLSREQWVELDKRESRHHGQRSTRALPTPARRLPARPWSSWISRFGRMFAVVWLYGIEREAGRMGFLPMYGDDDGRASVFEFALAWAMSVDLGGL